MTAELQHVESGRTPSPGPHLECTGSAAIPTEHGIFTAHSYRFNGDPIEHVALVAGDLDDGTTPLVRVHSECLTGDIFHSRRCDCGSQLDRAMHQIAAADSGVVVYLRGHEGRGIGLGKKLEAYALQDSGLDTVDANEALGFAPDLRDYEAAAAILAHLGISTARLLTNNPAKSEGLDAHGVRVVELVPLVGETTPENARYLETKRDRMGHLFDPVGPASAEHPRHLPRRGR